MQIRRLTLFRFQDVTKTEQQMMKVTVQNVWYPLRFQALISAIQNLFKLSIRKYQKLSGEFVPENVQKICGYYDAEQTNDRLVRSILRQKKKIICINDSNHEIDFEKVKKEINQAFEQVFSEKSSFENSI